MGFLGWTQAAAHPVLRGDGLLLRLPERRDYRDWRDLRDASRTFLTPWEPVWSPDELSTDAFRARLRRYRHDARERTSYTFLIFDAEERTLYGGLTLGRIQRGVAQSGTIGYWMGAPHAGRGIMTAAVRLVCGFAFEIAALHRLEAACLPRNERSARLLHRCGFRHEGYLRDYLKIAGVWEDHDLYALLAREFVSDASPARRPQFTLAQR